MLTPLFRLCHHLKGHEVPDPRPRPSPEPSPASWSTSAKCTSSPPPTKPSPRPASGVLPPSAPALPPSRCAGVVPEQVSAAFAGSAFPLQSQSVLVRASPCLSLLLPSRGHRLRRPSNFPPPAHSGKSAAGQALSLTGSAPASYPGGHATGPDFSTARRTVTLLGFARRPQGFPRVCPCSSVPSVRPGRRLALLFWPRPLAERGRG